MRVKQLVKAKYPGAQRSHKPLSKHPRELLASRPGELFASFQSSTCIMNKFNCVPRRRRQYVVFIYTFSTLHYISTIYTEAARYESPTNQTILKLNYHAWKPP